MIYMFHTLCKPGEDNVFSENFHLAGPKLFCNHSMLRELWQVFLLQADGLQTSEQF